MKDSEKKEEKNKRVGWLVSVGVQLFLLVLFYFLIAWKAPFPPIPEYGIELGFSQSAGAVLPTESASPAEEAPEEDAEQEESDNIQDEVTENLDDTSEKIEEVVETVEESETPVEEVVKASSAAMNERIEKKTADEVVDETAEKDEPTEEVQEEKQPEIDERAIYGSQGASSGNEEGASLALSGWIWDFKPKPNDESEETGKIVYKIVVDEDGYLVKIETVISTVSPSVERKYRAAVQKLTFSKTSDYKSAPLSTGTLTFIIKTK
ncbi:MAG: hypothetical protein RIM99_09495 [Cyclobacteriaceae bacterium]